MGPMMLNIDPMETGRILPAILVGYDVFAQFQGRNVNQVKALAESIARVVLQELGEQ